MAMKRKRTWRFWSPYRYFKCDRCGNSDYLGPKNDLSICLSYSCTIYRLKNGL